MMIRRAGWRSTMPSLGANHDHTFLSDGISPTEFDPPNTSPAGADAIGEMAVAEAGGRCPEPGAVRARSVDIARSLETWGERRWIVRSRA